MESLASLSIKGFIEASFVDWPGKLCSVIFFPRCNFRCRYCHNGPLLTNPDLLQDIPFSHIMNYLQRERAWIDGVCLSGGEATLQPKLPDIFAYIKAQGFLTKLDTNGSNSELLRRLIDERLVDYVAMDVKAVLDERSYCAITQSASVLEEVKQSIRILIDSPVEHEFRLTVVPSYHGPDEILQVARDLNGASRLRIQNFNPASVLDSSLESLKPFDDDFIDRYQQQVNTILAH
ncbi:MAG: anaerobic ribonucleoside-triphosphate reductase activating protein [Deltaproteobacteria bacterium]|nr:anaerobic ribonucleoside-triphosphate reductase activating protein [Deltaproteobacteria bacterium]